MKKFHTSSFPNLSLPNQVSSSSYGFRLKTQLKMTQKMGTPSRFIVFACILLWVIIVTIFREKNKDKKKIHERTKLHHEILRWQLTKRTPSQITISHACTFRKTISFLINSSVSVALHFTFRTALNSTLKWTRTPLQFTHDQKGQAKKKIFDIVADYRRRNSKK